MPRGNPNVWKQHGASYAELSAQPGGQQTSAGPSRLLPPVTAQDVAAVRAAKAAGTPASMKPRGVGTFQLQTTWSLGEQPQGQATQAAGTSGRSHATETKMQYQPPPEGYSRREPLRTDKCTIPKPNYPNDWSTSKQADFPPDLLKRLEPSRAHPVRDSGRLLPSDVPPHSQFATQQRADFPGRSAAQARAVAPSGGTRTQPAGYNIITGGSSYNNNVFEAWDARDYRRHR